MQCPNCAAVQPDNAMFCDNCGSPLGGAAAGGVAPTAPAMHMPPGQPAPMPAAPVMQPPAAAGGSICPNCSQPVMAGQAFCENCGYALGAGAPAAPAVYAPPAAPAYTPPQQVQQPYAPPAAPPAYVPPAPPAYTPPAAPAYTPPPAMQPAYGPAMPPGRLVIAGGAQIQLAGKTEYMIGREDAVSGNFPDVNLGPYGAEQSGVSRRHAKIVAMGGWFLEDLRSVNGTHLNRQRLAEGQRMPLNNGDEIRLGKLVMNFYTS